MLKKLLLILAFFILTTNQAEALPVSSPSPLPLQEENIKVQTHKIEAGKSLTLISQNPTHYVVSDPQVAVLTLKPDAVEIKAQRIGTALVIWWDETGIKSAQIVVTRSHEEIQRTIQLKKESSRLFQSQQSRHFKVFYDTGYSILEKDKVLSRVSEVQKIYNHQPQFQGSTPYGELKGSLFYEYRKDQTLKKSVALVRDMWLSLVGTDFPFAKLLDDYDLSVGRQYLKLDNFGFPGARYTGFTFVPTEKRIKNPKKGRIDLSFFAGRERRGAYLDNPAGTNQRNVKLKNRFMGEKIDFYPWKNGRISLGSYQKWGGPTDASQSKKNSDLDFNLGFPHFRLKGETGLNYRSHAAWRFTPILESSWLTIENSFFRVNPHYSTITGTTLDQGRRGYELHANALPFKPIWGSEAILVDMDAEMSRDLLSLNQKNPERHNRKLNVGINWRLPYRFNSRTFVEYESRLGTSFPYTRKRFHENFGKEFLFKNRWVKRLRLYSVSTLERYGDAEGTPGFNSTRYEAGGGSYLSLFGGLWLSGQYLWDRLDEKEPAPRPDADGRIYPGQLTLAGGISQSLRRLPINMSVSVRYTDERKTLSKLHQPFTLEDRFEVRGDINWKLPYDWIFYTEVSAITTDPLTAGPNTAELSLIMGGKLAMDTHVYLPQKGTIEGYFFMDQNVNGVRDEGEVGIKGYEVWIEGGPRTKTDSEGHYRLRVHEGTVQLKTTPQLPEGYFYTTLNEQEIELFPKQQIKFDFGIVPQIQVKGQVYLDMNHNLLFDPDDIPMPNIQILLESGQFAVTSPQGLYSVLRVRPGANSAQVVVSSIPSGYRTLTPIERKFDGMPGDVLIFDVAMTADRVVSGYVFEDLNQNGKMDPDEKGILGVTVSGGGKKVVTGNDGRYLLSDLEPGTVRIEIDRNSLKRGYKIKLFGQNVEIPKEFFVKNDASFPVEPESFQQETQ